MHTGLIALIVGVTLIVGGIIGTVVGYNELNEIE